MYINISISIYINDSCEAFSSQLPRAGAHTHCDRMPQMAMEINFILIDWCARSIDICSDSNNSNNNTDDDDDDDDIVTNHSCTLIDIVDLLLRT